MAQPTSFPEPPLRESFFDASKKISLGWIQWLQAVTSNLIAPVVVTSAFASNAPGQPGQISTDGNFIYVCTAKNTWKRAALVVF